MKKKTMRLLAAALTVLMVFLLAGCEVSSSSSSTTTVTTSTTDENGNTTTNTTTTEVGVSAGSDGVTTTNQTTTETTTSSADDAAAEAEEATEADDGSGLKEHLKEGYNKGAKGSNEAGDTFYYAYNDEDGNDAALLIIISADRQNYNGWEGTAETVDDQVVLTSNNEEEVPFTFSEVDGDGNFTMTFVNDGDVAEMQLVDFDSFVDEVVAARMEFSAN